MAIQKLFTSLSKSAQSATHVGEVGRIWYDTRTGFRIGDGVTPGGQAAAVAVTNANIGDLVITGATISTLNTNEDLNLVSNGTGNVNVKGAFVTATTGGRTIIETVQNGTLNFYVPTIGYDSAIDIVGSSDGSIVAPQNTGVLLHLTGQDSLPARIYNDSANNYAAFIGRRYNGTASAPTQVLAGNIIARVGATPYGSTGWPSISTARVDFVALENQTASNQGTSIQFYTTPVGTASSTPSMTVASTGISNAANVVPFSDETYFLGSPALRWQGVYVGKGGLTMADSTTNVNVPISVNNGTLYLNSVQNIAVGNLVITDTTLTTATAATNINVGAISDTGDLVIGRTTQILSQNLSQSAALLINGTLSNTVPTEYTNTLFHTVAVPGYNGIHLSDTFGTGVFSTFEGRHARGNIANPSASQSGDILLRVAAAGYGTNTFDTALGTQGGSRIDFRATENYTNTAKGSDIHFWTTQPGTTSTVNSGTIDWQGFTGNAFTFATDNTVQTTAGIPMTFRGNLSATKVATLDINNTLDPAQIPTSITGGVIYKGGWNASSNTAPSLGIGLPAGVQTGWEYSITTTGTQDIGSGSQSYVAGGFVIYSGSAWSYVPAISNFTSLTAGTHLTASTPTGAITLTVDATNANTASTIVSRDALGNFNANTITATLSGSATSATTAATVTGATQSAITAVGTLTSLAVTGNITAGNVTATSGTISAATGQFTNINNSLAGANAAIVTANSAVVSYVNTLNSAMAGNVAGANAAIVTANTGMKSYVDAVTTAWTTNTAGLYNSILGANTAIQTLSANIGAFEIYSNANVGAIYNTVTTHTTWLGNLQANIGAFEIYSNANTAGLYNSILGANTAIQTLSANVGAFETFSNANVGAIYNTVTTHTTWLGNLQANVNSYSNANVVAYLTTATINTTGNITAGNATIINTLTANTVITGLGGIRTISGGTPTITLNFNTDKIIQVYQPAGTVTLQYGTLVAGASITVLINLTTARNIVSGVSASNNINLGGKTNIGGVGNAPAATAQSLVKLVYTSVDGTAGNTYCAVNYS
jgi:hypothetical protein